MFIDQAKATDGANRPPPNDQPAHGILAAWLEVPGDVQDIRLVVDTIPTLAWSTRPDGSAEFFNQALAGLYRSIFKASSARPIGESREVVRNE